ncbi:MAG: YutD family protein [Bacilli bacterium]
MTEQVTVSVGNLQFQLIIDFREGFEETAFKDRYSEILNRYDYVVGDWGYNQLRLKGFFDDQNQRAANGEAKISTLNEYLYEHCNFGAKHFVLKRIRK